MKERDDFSANVVRTARPPGSTQIGMGRELFPEWLQSRGMSLTELAG